MPPRDFHVDFLQKSAQDQARIRGFAQLTEEFCGYIGTTGRTVTPYEGSWPRYFAALDADSAQNVLAHFRHYVSVYRAAFEAKDKLDDNRQVLWRMLTSAGLRPPSDLFQRLEDDDIIEIYLLPQSTQIFRNFSFYDVCSYTLDDILCRPWYELYQRDEAITQSMLASAMSLLDLRSPCIVEHQVGVHEQVEVDSEAGLQAKVNSRFLVSLCAKDHTVVACLNVVKALSVTRRSRATLESLAPAMENVPPPVGRERRLSLCRESDLV